MSRCAVYLGNEACEKKATGSVGTTYYCSSCMGLYLTVDNVLFFSRSGSMDGIARAAIEYMIAQSPETKKKLYEEVRAGLKTGYGRKLIDLIERREKANG